MKNTFILFFTTIVLSIAGVVCMIPTHTFAADNEAITKTKSKLQTIGGISGFITPGTALFEGDAPFYAKFAAIVNIFLGMIGIITTIYIFYAGVKWITAGGNAEQVTAAKDGIRSAVIGLAVIFLGYTLINFVIMRVIEAVTK